MTSREQPRASSLAFKIRGMDCAEEIAVLKRELLPLVKDENLLAFDLLNAKLTVHGLEGTDAEDAIVRAVARTGMTAVPWLSPMSREGAIEQGFWSRYGGTLPCVCSGVCVVAALVTGAVLGAAGAPAWLVRNAPVGFYLVSIAVGLSYIAPKAWLALKRLRPDMNLLMTIAVIGAMGIGQWFEAATVTFLFTLALLLESWSVAHARNAIHALMDLSPATARYYCPTTGAVEEAEVEEVPVGVTALVRPGERIPLDGVVVKGSTSVNQAPITGESAPVERGVGDEVFAGSINNEGAFEFRVTKPAQDTTLARIIHMVEEAQARRAPTEQWVAKFAAYYTPAMMALAVLVAVVPPLVAGGWGRWFYEALVILVIACPCALVISTPVSIVAGLTAAARAGVLIKGGVYLEAPARLRAVALDKTGTLTTGRPEVQQVVPLDGHTEPELIARAAALEVRGEHPIAQAIVRYAASQGISYAPAETYSAIRGKGAEGLVMGRLFWVGSHRYVHERWGADDTFHDTAAALEDAGHSVVAIGNDNHVCGFVSLADAVRPNAAATVAALKAAGVQRIVMLTGDNEGTARAAAEATGVDEFRAELLPEDKVAAVESLVNEFKHVAMVGDGVNDAPALAASTVGIAMGAAGTDAAIETADIALMSDDLSKLPWLIAHSRRTLTTIQQNIVVAVGVKAVFLAMALLGMATLWMAIAADMGASLLVIFNGLRLLETRTTSTSKRQ